MGQMFPGDYLWLRLDSGADAKGLKLFYTSFAKQQC